MPQLFKPRDNPASRFIIGIGTVVLVAILLGLGIEARSSYSTSVGRAPEQPVPFSHEHHNAQLGIECAYCHTSVEKSAFAGIPPTYTCMSCHSQLWTNADMLAPVRQSLEQNKPLRWNRVHELPDYVFFNHSIHVNKGVGCESCHGRVDKMPLTFKAEPMTMSWCLECHRDPAPNLRPHDAIYTMGWEPPEDREILAAKLMRKYDIKTSLLSNCSTCHR